MALNLLVIGQGGFPFPPFLEFCFPSLRIFSEGQIGLIGLFNEGLTPKVFNGSIYDGLHGFSRLYCQIPERIPGSLAKLFIQYCDR